MSETFLSFPYYFTLLQPKMNYMHEKTPTKQGQICKIINQKSGAHSSEEYILIDNPDLCNDDDVLRVVDLKDMQRNVHDPSLATPKQVLKQHLSVIGEDLASYVASWNTKNDGDGLYSTRFFVPLFVFKPHTWI